MGADGSAIDGSRNWKRGVEGRARPYPGGASQDGQSTLHATTTSPFGPAGHGVVAMGHDKNWQSVEPAGHWSRHAASAAQVSTLQAPWLQLKVQLLNGSHCTAQIPEVHVNSQVLPSAQVQAAL